MPGPLLAAGIAAGAQLASTGINAAATSSLNRKTRRWNERQYAIQRSDALDNWNRENSYNSPVAQMARLREAGLNPNLVYGNGATTEGGSISNAQAPSWNPRAPEIDLGSAATSGLSAYYDMKIKDAQLRNMETQNDVMIQDATLKTAQTIAQMTGVENTKSTIDLNRFKLQQDSQLSPYVLEAAVQNIKKMTADTDFTLSQNERAESLNASSLREAAERILNMRSQRATDAKTRQQINAQIENLRKDGTLKQLDIDLKKTGVQPHDALWQRTLADILGDASKIDGLFPNKMRENLKNPDYKRRFDSASNKYFPNFKK